MQSLIIFLKLDNPMVDSYTRYWESIYAILTKTLLTKM